MYVYLYVRGMTRVCIEMRRVLGWMWFGRGVACEGDCLLGVWLGMYADWGWTWLGVDVAWRGVVWYGGGA